jgi:hypothetical protein
MGNTDWGLEKEQTEALRKERDDLKSQLGDADFAYREIRDGYVRQQKRIHELEGVLRRMDDVHGCECSACKYSRTALKESE